MGRDLSRGRGTELSRCGRPVRAPPLAALRGGARGFDPWRDTALDGVPARRSQGHWRGDRRLFCRVRDRAFHRRIRPPARRAVHQPGQSTRPGMACRRLRSDDGADPVHPDDPRGGDRSDAGPGEDMTALEAVIAGQIQATGPLRMDDYMRLCLLHPEHGYYATRDPLGVQGDFTTAPEISQMFGELLGLALAQAWLDQGAPGAFVLAETGPGRGTLMADILRATRAVPGFHAAAQVHLIEASNTLRAVQRDTLARDGLIWAETVDDLPDQPLFLLANEFFDALPVRQFQRDGDGWRERCVGLQSGALALGLTDRQHAPQLAHRLDDTRDGDIVET